MQENLEIFSTVFLFYLNMHLIFETIQLGTYIRNLDRVLVEERILVF